MLDLLVREFTPTAQLPFVILIMRLAGTVLLCGVIGLEREFQRNSAGLRTNIMVGLAAATFALISLSLLDGPAAADSNVRADPLRLVEAVTAGVAFLAAGIIVFSKGEVRGLTTGAGMWLSASIGLAVGLGFWLIGLLASALGFIILTFFRQMEVRFGMKDD